MVGSSSVEQYVALGRIIRQSYPSTRISEFLFMKKFPMFRLVFSCILANWPEMLVKKTLLLTVNKNCLNFIPFEVLFILGQDLFFSTLKILFYDVTW